MRRWADATFIFISTNESHVDGGTEECWLPLMQQLLAAGSSVRFLAVHGSAIGARALTVGIPVDQYLLDRWNVVRSRSRLRKYLNRYAPVAVHSTGIEGDLMLRWAARKVPGTRVVHTLTSSPQGTRRSRGVDALMRRFDELGMRSAAAVIVDCEALADEVARAGVGRDRITVVDPDAPLADAVKRQMTLYRGFLAE